jgi:hypothetical protein
MSSTTTNIRSFEIYLRTKTIPEVPQRWCFQLRKLCLDPTNLSNVQGPHCTVWPSGLFALSAESRAGLNLRKQQTTERTRLWPLRQRNGAAAVTIPIREQAAAGRDGHRAPLCCSRYRYDALLSNDVVSIFDNRAVSRALDNRA